MPKLPPESLLHRVDLAIRMRMDGAAHGDSPALGMRGGIELDRIRPWTPGDDWRLLDAAATARTGEPHVRIPVAERRLTLWLGIDVSSSMAFGTEQWEKGDLALSLATAFGLISLRQAARVGGLALGAGDEVPYPPRAGKPALLKLVEELQPERDNLAGDLTASLTRLDRSVRQRSVVVVISDFRSDLGAGDEEGTAPSWQAPLTRIAGRHETICCEVFDPRELEIPDVGIARFVDPESGRRFTVDTASKRVRNRFARRAEQRSERVRHAIVSSGADHFKISTHDDWLDALMRQLDQRRKRQRKAKVWVSPVH